MSIKCFPTNCKKVLASHSKFVIFAISDKLNANKFILSMKNFL